MEVSALKCAYKQAPCFLVCCTTFFYVAFWEMSVSNRRCAVLTFFMFGEVWQNSHKLFVVAKLQSKNCLNIR